MATISCATCSGSGLVEYRTDECHCASCAGYDWDSHECPECLGAGKVEAVRCPSCLEAGELSDECDCHGTGLVTLEMAVEMWKDIDRAAEELRAYREAAE